MQTEWPQRPAEKTMAELAAEGAEQFCKMTPEYFPCPENNDTMNRYMSECNLPPTLEGYIASYKDLKLKHRIIPAREILARLDAEEEKEFDNRVIEAEKKRRALREGKEYKPPKSAAEKRKELMEQYGVPVHDHTGRVIGYNEPESWSRVPPRPSRRIPPSQLRSCPGELGPGGEHPSPKQWAQWSSDQVAAWVAEHGDKIPDSVMAQTRR